MASLPAFDTAYPKGSPLPALQHAMAGKLLWWANRPRDAVPHLEAACAGLAASHGAAHALVRQLRAVLAEVTAAASVPSSAADTRLA